MTSDADLAARMRELVAATEAGSCLPDAARAFVEAVTFADADAILAGLRGELAVDWMAMPVWARNLAFRLACLQRPDDPVLLREAAGDLLSFGPDWDDAAHALERRADEVA